MRKFIVASFLALLLVGCTTMSADAQWRRGRYWNSYGGYPTYYSQSYGYYPSTSYYATPNYNYSYYPSTSYYSTPNYSYYPNTYYSPGSGYYSSNYYNSGYYYPRWGRRWWR
jgi:hypothetical protein